VMRGPKKKGVRYFGPYAHAWAIRETLDLLLRVFPARTCSAGVFKRASQVGRPCLLGYIGKCSAPCVGRVSAEEHRSIVDDFCDFMAGQTDTLIRRLEKEMAASASELDFERAARLRDDVGALRRAMEKQAVVFGDGTDADVVAFAQDELEAAVQVFHVRGGRVRGQRGWTIDKAAFVEEEASTAALVEQFVTQFYGEQSEVDGGGNSIPREILVPELPADTEALSDWLAERRGGRVTMRVPQRGATRALMETVARNAGQAFAQHKLKRASDLTARSLAISELQEQLSLVEAPLRIECFDISHNQGTDVVASMVVFEDGLARRSEYRRFAMRETGGDTDWIAIWSPKRRRWVWPVKRSTAPPSARSAGASPTRPTSSSSTVVSPRPTPRRLCSTTSASATSPSSVWPSGSRRCGYRGRNTR
jgi:excinuclease ABC subunit C